MMQNMISYIGAGFIIISFISIIHYFGIIEKAKDTLKVARNAFSDLQNPNLDDDAKQMASKSHAKHLLFLSIRILYGTAVALILPIVVLWAIEWFGILSVSSIITTAVSWQSLLVTSAMAFLLFRAKSKNRTKIRYSFLERILYRFAFLTKSSQIAFADLEEQIFTKHLKAINHRKPVFITALPRTGTTLLLNICTQLNEFASHNYRDMPFILIPMLWNRISSKFQYTEAWQERAHGDGLLVNADSPEAFEEMIWMAFWKKQYHEDRIIPWDHNCDKDIIAEFLKFYKKHMQKIIALRQNSNNTVKRYISKNNNNIARLNMLTNQFPEATILIPFRDPIQQAASLLRQHQNFLKLHDEDRFACDYMKAIGHFDFGKNLKPIDFDRWLQHTDIIESNTLIFWIKYWIAVYGYINAVVDENTIMLSYDELCRAPREGLAKMAEVLDIKDRNTFVNQASIIRAPRLHQVDADKIPQIVSDQAKMIYLKLIEKSLL